MDAVYIFSDPIIDIIRILNKYRAHYNITNEEIERAMIYANESAKNNIIPGDWNMDGLDVICSLNRVIRERA